MTWEPPPRVRVPAEAAMLRGFGASLGVAIVLAVLLGLVTLVAHTITFHILLRGAISFGVMWIIIRVMHHFAGTAGLPFTVGAFVLTLLVMLSNFVALLSKAPPDPVNTAGAPASSVGIFILAVSCIPVIVGAGFAAWLEHEG